MMGEKMHVKNKTFSLKKLTKDTKKRNKKKQLT